MKKFLFKSITVIAATGLLIAGCDLAKKSEKSETIKIGLSLAQTGPTSDAGVPYAKGVEDICRDANESGLLGKTKVECIIRDDAYKNDVTKRNFEDFLEQGQTAYLNYSTGSTLMLKGDFEEEKIPVVTASFHADNVKDSKYIFIPIATYSEQAIALVEYVAKNHKNGLAKVAMFIHPSAFGRAPVNDVKKAIEAGLKAELVEVVEHGKDLDNTAMLQRLHSKGVQYIISQTVQSPVATMLKDAQRLNLSATSYGEEGKITFLGAHYTGGMDLIALAGSAAENFHWTTSYRLSTDKSEGIAFMQKLAAKYRSGDDKTANSVNYTGGAMSASILIEGIKRCQGTGQKISRACITTALNGMNGANAFDPKFAVGPVTYSDTDRSGVDMLQIYEAKDGKFFAKDEPFQSVYFSMIN